MEINPDQATDVEDQPTVKKKAVVKRKRAAAKSKRPRKVAAPVVEPVEQPLTMQEVSETLGKAKEEFVGVIAEPVMKALGRYSQIARDMFYGAVGGFLGSSKRKD